MPEQGHPGDYRGFVGPADQYDVIGDGQFALLYALGLRDHHQVLDIGCGSLRAGRLLIPYLAAIAATLAASGTAAVTFIHPGTGDPDALEIRLDDHQAPDWRYSGCYSYSRDEVAAAIDAAHLTGRPIDWHHPRHQWWLLTHSAEHLSH